MYRITPRHTSEYYDQLYLVSIIDILRNREKGIWSWMKDPKVTVPLNLYKTPCFAKASQGTENKFNLKDFIDRIEDKKLLTYQEIANLTSDLFEQYYSDKYGIIYPTGLMDILSTLCFESITGIEENIKSLVFDIDLCISKNKRDKKKDYPECLQITIRK